MYDKVIDILNNALVDANDKYDTLLAQSKNDNKKIRTLVRQLGEQTKTTVQSLESKIQAERQQEEMVRKKSIAQKTAAASIKTVQQVELKLLELSLNNNLIVQNNVELEITNNELEKKVRDLSAAAPINIIEKVYDKSLSNKGGQKTLPTFMWVLIMEHLVLNTPPAAVATNILSVIKAIAPHMDVTNLPSISTIRKGRTVLDTVCHTLAAYQLAKAEHWKQLHTDGTGRRQVALQNLVISLQTEEGGLLPVLLTTNIIPENETSEVVCEAILDAISCKGQLLTLWK